MCYMFFVGLERPMPIIRGQAGLMFYSWTLHEEYKVIREFITKPYVYELGSYMGCGCGFIGINKWARRSISRFKTYLSVPLEVGSVEIFYYSDFPTTLSVEKRHITMKDIRLGCFDHDSEMLILEPETFADKIISLS